MQADKVTIMGDNAIIKRGSKARSYKLDQRRHGALGAAVMRDGISGRAKRARWHLRPYMGGEAGWVAERPAYAREVGTSES